MTKRRKLSRDEQTIRQAKRIAINVVKSLRLAEQAAREGASSDPAISLLTRKARQGCVACERLLNFDIP